MIVLLRCIVSLGEAMYQSLNSVELSFVAKHKLKKTFVKNLRSFSIIALRIPYCAQFHT